MKRILQGLFIFLLIVLAALPVYAQESNTVTVISGEANIRSGPSTATSVLGVVQGGTVLNVSGRSGTGWWRVDSAFGTGWISTRITVFRGDRNSIPITSDPAGITITSPTLAVAAYGPAKVYTNPNANSFVVAIIPSGSSAEIIGQTGDGAWFQVTFGAIVGFVNTGTIVRRGSLEGIPYIRDPGPGFGGPTVQLHSDQPVYSEAGQVFATLPAGTTTPIVGRNADNTRWMVAVQGAGLGWISVGNVSIAGAASNIPLRTGDTTAGPAADGLAHATATVIIDRKLFYATPSFGVVMLDGGRGTEVGVLGRSSDGLWLKVLAGANQVWMVFSGITLNGNMAAIPVVDDTPRIFNHVVINAYRLNVRSGPGAQYTILATVAGGDVLPVTGVSPDGVWWRVEGDWGVGWVRTRYILFRGDVNLVPIATQPVGPIAPATAVTRRTVPVYSSANITGEVGFLPINTEYVITGRNADWTMYQLDTPLGLVWIQSGNIYFRGDYDVVPLIQ